MREVGVCVVKPKPCRTDPTYILKSDVVVEVDKVREVLSQDGFKEGTEIETTDIYLLPPHEDPETCTSWLRMRNRDGHYTLMFEETVCDGDVMISPRIKFEVGVRILGGLMALGYEVGAIMKRKSKSWSDEMLEIKIDWIEAKSIVHIFFKKAALCRLRSLAFYYRSPPVKNTYFFFKPRLIRRRTSSNYDE